MTSLYAHDGIVDPKSSYSLTIASSYAPLASPFLFPFTADPF